MFVLSWLHDEKDDGLTERVLSVEMVGKNVEPTSTDEQMGDKEFQEEYQDQEVGYLLFASWVFFHAFLSSADFFQN